MSTDLITLVIAMREAQKEFFETKKRGAMMEAIKYETRVDAWIQNYMAERVQLEMWAQAVKTDEVRGYYDVGDEGETQATCKV